MHMAHAVEIKMGWGTASVRESCCCLVLFSHPFTTLFLLALSAAAWAGVVYGVCSNCLYKNSLYASISASKRLLLLVTEHHPVSHTCSTWPVCRSHSGLK